MTKMLLPGEIVPSNASERQLYKQPKSSVLDLQKVISNHTGACFGILREPNFREPMLSIKMQHFLIQNGSKYT